MLLALTKSLDFYAERFFNMLYPNGIGKTLFATLCNIDSMLSSHYSKKLETP